MNPARQLYQLHKNLHHNNFCFSKSTDFIRNCLYKLLRNLYLMGTAHKLISFEYLLRVVWMHCMGLVSADHERFWDGLLKGYSVFRPGRDPLQDPLKDGGHGSLGALGTNLGGGGGGGGGGQDHKIIKLK